VQPGELVIALGKLRKFDNVVFLTSFGVVQVMDPKEAESFKLEAELAKHYYHQVDLNE
jgi:hypothetical protein